MKRLIFNAENYSSFGLNLGLLIFRIFVGITMAFSHGLGKIPPAEQFVGAVRSMGLPAPEISAWLAGLSEFGGGILIALGLATRLAAGSWIITMSVAAFMVHAADPWGRQEPAMMFMACGVLLLCSGAGKFSIDGLISK